MAKIAVAMALLLCLAEESQATFLPGLVVDNYSPYASMGLNAAAFSPIGQSFTPTLNGIQFAAFGLSAFSSDPTAGGTLDVQLFQGVGNRGALLATSAITTPPAGFGQRDLGEFVYFYFARKVSLISGSPYTLMLEQLSGEPFFVRGSGGLSQAGSQGILRGQADPNVLLAYAEGTLAVPEPSTLVSASVAGLVGLGLAWRRRKAKLAA